MNKTLAIALILTAGCFGLHSISSAQNCDLTVDAGADQIICNPGTIMLNASSSDQPFLVSWTPAGSVNDPDNLNTTASVGTTTTFQVQVSSYAEVNLINNGDFSQGDTGFSTDYTYGTGGPVGLLTNEGQYAIADNSGDTHNQFADCNDHTGGGNMMVVNGSGNPDNVWCQAVAISQNTAYLFSAWVTSVVSQNPADLQFSVNGNLLGSVFNAPSSTCNWNEFSTTWFSGPNTSVDICIANVNDDPAGNDFALDDIALFEICETTDEVTITVAELNADFNANASYCQEEAAFNPDLLLDADADSGGTWTLDGNTITSFDPSSITPGNHTLSYTVTEGSCEVSTEQTVEILTTPSAGTSNATPTLCEGESTIFSLADLLEGEDTGGTWEETSANPSGPGAFDPNAATFNTDGQIPGIYQFRYTVQGVSPCPDDESIATIEIVAAPIADAGVDMSLGCGINEVSIGGPATSTNGNYSYEWQSVGGSPVADPSMPFTEAEKADTYILTVVDLDSGCSATDEVNITANVNNIAANGTVSPLNCFGINDGAITINDVSGGVEPYSFALDGGSFGASPQFGNLAAGNYTVTVRDANGCELSLDFIIPQPAELVAEIIANINPPLIVLGDSLTLSVLVNKPTDEIESIVWSDPEACENCESFTVKPNKNTTYEVTVTDITGCTATSSLTVIVDRDLKLYIPNAFSPNDDGINDLFMIYSGTQIQSIKSFQVLNRWGDLIFSATDFQPEDPDTAWDGSFNGKRLNPGIFIYVAEIELSDGEIVVVSGDVMLLY